MTHILSPSKEKKFTHYEGMRRVPSEGSTCLVAETNSKIPLKIGQNPHVWVVNMLVLGSVTSLPWPFFGWNFCILFRFVKDTVSHLIGTYFPTRVAMRNRNDLAQFQLDEKAFMTVVCLIFNKFDLPSMPHHLELLYLDTKLFSLFFLSKRGPGVFLPWKHLRQEWRASLFYGFEVSIRNPSSPADLWWNAKVRWYSDDGVMRLYP